MDQDLRHLLAQAQVALDNANSSRYALPYDSDMLNSGYANALDYLEQLLEMLGKGDWENVSAEPVQEQPSSEATQKVLASQLNYLRAAQIVSFLPYVYSNSGIALMREFCPDIDNFTKERRPGAQATAVLKSNNKTTPIREGQLVVKHKSGKFSVMSREAILAYFLGQFMYPNTGKE